MHETNMNLAKVEVQPIYFVSINYNCSKLLQQLVICLENQNEQGIYLIIVDNTPHDPGLDTIINNIPIHFLRPTSNLGFGAGCNLALEYIESQDTNAIAWFLNPDAKLLPDAIKIVRLALGDKDVSPALLGTKICDINRKPWFTSGSFNRWTGSINGMPSSQSASKYAVTRYIETTDWVSGCSLILNLCRLPFIPKFDSAIFLYYEDVELCMRLRRSGYPCYVTKSTLVEHIISATTSKQPRSKYRHSTFGKLYTLLRHGTRLSLMMNCLYILLQIIILNDGSGPAAGRLEGLRDFASYVFRKPAIE